ncbi:glycosyltransferase [Aureimonas sp. AU12]|uniref:glycosyltransferase n=1 Tax=Aureimonas sp. AU12 TaxID=1638161 RepID=UPI0009E69AFB|nr:glycosyltransferase [Aureimonas sp. AU12]
MIEWTDPLAPALATFALAMMVVPWLDRDHVLSRQIMAAVTFAFLLRYALWRVFETLPAAGLTVHFFAGLLFLAIELTCLLAASLGLVFLSRTKNRTVEVEANQGWFAAQAPPLVDVLICTYNEDQTILERTMAGATGIDYPNFRVWVLDDGRRPWLEDLAGRLGCKYLTRPDNAHAKAGNINHALAHLSALPERPDFVSILDADFVPLPQFLSRALCLFREPGVGLVQTPQHFINPDPIQTNLAVTRVWPDEQRYFFDVIMASKDAWGAAFCCGTSSVIRFDPLVRIGGFPTDSVTEDYLLTLRLKEFGYTTSYLNEALTFGLAPEGLKEYITQRGRWCLGFMQIVRGRSGPFSRTSSLNFIDRLSLFDSFLGWAVVYPARVLGLLLPLLYLLFGLHIVETDLSSTLEHFLPFFLWQMVTLGWISQGRSLPIMSDVSQVIATPAIIKAVFVGLARPKGQKFKVTAKGGDRDLRFVEWPLLRIFAALIALNLSAITYAFAIDVRGDLLTNAGVALIWCWYNLAILAITCFICVEQPRHRKAERFPTNEAIGIDLDGGSESYHLIDISISGARIEGTSPVPAGTTLSCTIRGRTVDATVVRCLGGSFAIKFDESLNVRVTMIRAFYTGRYLEAFHGVNPTDVGRAVVQRVFS